MLCKLNHAVVTENDYFAVVRKIARSMDRVPVENIDGTMSVKEGGGGEGEEEEMTASNIEKNSR